MNSANSTVGRNESNEVQSRPGRSPDPVAFIARQTRARSDRRRASDDPALAPAHCHRHRHQTGFARPGLFPPAAGRAIRAAFPHLQVPHDDARRRNARRANHRRPGSPRHAQRAVPAQIQAGRGAATAERGQRRDEPGRAATGSSTLRRALHRRAATDSGVEAGHHQPGLNRLQRRERIARRTIRSRSFLSRAPDARENSRGFELLATGDCVE